MGGDGINLTDPISQIVTQLLSYGLPGILIIILLWAYNNKDKRVDALQDTLIELSKEYAKAVAENTAAINALRDLLISRERKG